MYIHKARRKFIKAKGLALLASCVWGFSRFNSFCRCSEGCTSNCSAGEEFEGSFDYLSTCVCLLVLRWDLSPAGWPSSSTSPPLWAAPASPLQKAPGAAAQAWCSVNYQQEERKRKREEEKSSSTTYSPRQVLLVCDSPIISLLLCLPLHPLLQVLQCTKYPLC